MKYVLLCALSLIGCNPTALSVKDATTVSEYQAAIELCLAQEKADHASGLPDAQVLSAYQACAANADKLSGRVAQ